MSTSTDIIAFRPRFTNSWCAMNDDGNRTTLGNFRSYAVNNYATYPPFCRLARATGTEQPMVLRRPCWKEILADA